MKQVQNQSDVLTSEFVHRLEQIESSYWMKYYNGNSVFPTYATVISGGLACAIPDVDILAMNRTLGISGTIDQTTLDQVIRFYQKAGSPRFFIQLPPSEVNEDVTAILEGNGFIHHNNWTKLYRTVNCPDIPVNEELSIRQIDHSEADIYGQLILMSFDWQDSRLASWLASTVGQAGYRHYIVTLGGKAIAAGALYIGGEMASMAFAGTLSAFRGMGAQGLLLKTRLIDACHAGAKYITSETAQPLPDREVKSHKNMVKFGFKIAYQRQNWLLQLR